MDMIERVARALIESGGSTPWEEMDDSNSDEPTWYRDHYFRMARAAIEAMREPTDAMCEAADWSQYSEVLQYQRAIDAALADQNPKPDVAEGITKVDDAH